MRPRGRRAREIIDGNSRPSTARPATGPRVCKVCGGVGTLWRVDCVGGMRERTCHATGAVTRHRQGGEADRNYRSGARIQIEQRVAEGEPCVVEVQGDDRAVEERDDWSTRSWRQAPRPPTWPTRAAWPAGLWFPPQPNVARVVRPGAARARGSFSSASDTPPGSPIPGYAVPPVPLLPYGFPPAQYGPPPPGSPIPGLPVAGAGRSLDANEAAYWPQLGASWSRRRPGRPIRGATAMPIRLAAS